MRNLSIMFVLWIGILFSVQTYACTYSGGSGTQEDPFQLSSVDDWISFSAAPTDWDKYFLLVSDIDLISLGTLTPLWHETGDESFGFSGVFNGNGHVLLNPKVCGGDIHAGGVFAVIEPEGVVKNLCISNMEASGNYSVGGLCGVNKGLISNCYIDGSVTGNRHIGGVCGYNQSRIEYSKADSHVTGNHDVGGVVGTNAGFITNSWSIGCTTASIANAGGFCGSSVKGHIVKCYSLSNVIGKCITSGGFCGTVQSRVYQCYAAGAVNNINGNSGFCGIFNGGDADVKDCFWDTETTGQAGSAAGTGLLNDQMKDVSTFTDAGWIFGKAYDQWSMTGGNYPEFNWKDTQLRYSGGTGSVSDPYKIANTDDLIAAGLILTDYDKCFELMADIDLTGLTFDRSIFKAVLDISWTGFTGSFNGNNHVISNLEILTPSNYSFSSLFGKIDDGSQICNLQVMDADISGGYTSGILCGEATNSTIINCKTSGKITGEGKVGGLVASSYESEIRNCSADVNAKGYANVAAFCGINDGSTIIQCFSSGSAMASDSQAGGFCGLNFSGGVIKKCYSNANAKAIEGSSGGFCGLNDGLISDCYSTGTVTGNRHNNAGFCGECYRTGTILRCYSTSLVQFEYYSPVHDVDEAIGCMGFCGKGNYSSINQMYNCFWNIESSRQSTSYGGLGLYTNDMHDIDTYLNASWDFVGESLNGTMDTWHMPYGYSGPPLLFFQKDIPGDIAGDYGIDLDDLAVVAGNWLTGK